MWDLAAAFEVRDLDARAKAGAALRDVARMSGEGAVRRNLARGWADVGIPSVLGVCSVVCVRGVWDVLFSVGVTRV